jgi:hypothetical protein
MEMSTKAFNTDKGNTNADLNFNNDCKSETSYSNCLTFDSDLRNKIAFDVVDSHFEGRGEFIHLASSKRIINWTDYRGNFALKYLSEDVKPQWYIKKLNPTLLPYIKAKLKDTLRIKEKHETFLNCFVNKVEDDYLSTITNSSIEQESYEHEIDPLISINSFNVKQVEFSDAYSDLLFPEHCVLLGEVVEQRGHELFWGFPDIGLFLDKQINTLVRIIKILSVSSAGKRRWDIRHHIRSIIRFLFKNMNDECGDYSTWLIVRTDYSTNAKSHNYGIKEKMFGNFGSISKNRWQKNW